MVMGQLKKKGGTFIKEENTIVDYNWNVTSHVKIRGPYWMLQSTIFQKYQWETKQELIKKLFQYSLK